MPGVEHWTDRASLLRYLVAESGFSGEQLEQMTHGLYEVQKKQLELFTCGRG